jgi:hypothetical protein
MSPSRHRVTRAVTCRVTPNALSIGLVITPDLVLVHDPRDTHQDHRTAFRAVASGARRVPSIMTYEGPSTVHFQPTIFNPIDTVIEQKLALIQTHRSQLVRTRTASWATVTALYRHMQWKRQVGFAEAFRAVRLSLPPGGLQQAEPEHTTAVEHFTTLPPIAELLPLLRTLDHAGVPNATS